MNLTYPIIPHVSMSKLKEEHGKAAALSDLMGCIWLQNYLFIMGKVKFSKKVSCSNAKVQLIETNLTAAIPSVRIQHSL